MVALPFFFAGAVFLLDGADELLLGHGAVEAAEVAFDFAEVTDFVCEFHWLLQIAIFISLFAIFVKRVFLSCFLGLRRRTPVYGRGSCWCSELVVG